MKIIYTSHLEFRLKARNIPYNLPREIFIHAEEHYYDNLTRHYIAVHQIKLSGRIRDMALTYDKSEDSIAMITIHPLKPYQKYSRINSGRWNKI